MSCTKTYGVETLTPAIFSRLSVKLALSWKLLTTLCKSSSLSFTSRKEHAQSIWHVTWPICYGYANVLIIIQRAYLHNTVENAETVQWIHMQLTFLSLFYKRLGLLSRALSEPVISEEDRELIGVNQLPGHESQRTEWYLKWTEIITTIQRPCMNSIIGKATRLYN